MLRAIFVVPVVLFVSLFAILVPGHAAPGDELRWRGSGGWGAGLPYNRLFDPALVRDVAGEIVAIERFTPLPGMAEGVLLRLRTPEESVAVHLAPLWYLERQDVALTPGTRVSIRGSRVILEGKPALLGMRVSGNGRALTLREENGLPLWSAWRQETPR